MTQVSGDIRQEHQMFVRQRQALVTGLALLGLAAVLTVIVAARPRAPWFQGLDHRWLVRMTNVRTPGLTRLAKLMSRIGGARVTWPIRVAVGAVLGWQRRWLQLGAFIGATISSELCIGPLKALVDRPRPPAPLILTSSASFPSGHAIAGAVTAFGVVIVFMHATPRRLVFIGVAAAIAGLVAVSRTYLAAHWLSDVIAGACIGTGLALVWSAGLGLLRDRARLRG
jgi:membrane-associated phospholipid phosphatase